MPVSSAAKLASHIWRGAAQSAANAAHNSANTFRGAFQGASGSTSSTGSSASGWASGLSSGGSSAGAGAGGAKFHAGRGAYHSYQHTGRVLSQASTSSGNDANSKSNDDEDEIRRQKAYKLRLDGHLPTLASPGHLTNSHMQVRFRHAFAANHAPLLLTAADSAHADQDANTAAQSTRHISSSAAQADAASVEASQQQANNSAAGFSAHDRLYKALRHATARRDAAQIRDTVAAFNALPKEQKTTKGYNMVMESLLSIRHTGQPVREITDTYNAMLQEGLSPNSRTYTVLVKALCALDAETHGAQTFNAAQPRATAPTAQYAAESTTTPAADDNFGQALELMKVAHGGRLWFDDAHAYNAMLSSCALRGDVDSALGVLDLLERSLFANTDATTFKHLITTFVTDPQLKQSETHQMHEARKLTACKQVFDEFLLASQNPDWNHDRDAVVWCSLIDAHFALNDAQGAVRLFEKMLEGGDNVPALDSHVVSAMIRGFLNIGDVTTALQWYTKLTPAEDMQGSQAQSTESHMPRPTHSTVEQLIVSLAQSGNDELLEPLLRVFQTYARTLFKPHAAQFAVLANVLTAHVASVKRMTDAGAKQDDTNAVLDRALEAASSYFGCLQDSLHFYDPIEYPHATQQIVEAFFALSDALMAAGRHVDAGSALSYVGFFFDRLDLTIAEFATLTEKLSQLAASFLAADAEAQDANAASLRLFAAAQYVVPLLRAADRLDESTAQALTTLYRSVHAQTPEAVPSLPLSADAWTLILEAFCFEEANLRPLSLDAFKADGIPMVLNDLAKLPAPEAAAEAAPSRPAVDLTKAAEVASSKYGDEALALFPDWATQALAAARKGAADGAAAASATVETTSDVTASESQLSGSTPASTPPRKHSPLQRQDLPAPALSNANIPFFPPVEVVDTDFGQTLFALARPSGQDGAPRVYGDVRKQMRAGVYAHPEGLAQLIGAFGRLGDVERVEELYAMSQHVLHALAGDARWQSKAWFYVEDHMIQALSHAGRPEAATAHRHRMIAAGGSPGATSYAALIATIRETTDDATIAQELFEESQRFGVRPTAYLFNVVISKLSRARKADRALQLFDEMTQTHGIKPTSVTYGAVINACTRIGDEQRAVQLFERMERDPSFKPRVPPYNTMMQFFIQSVPDRERALGYYNKMRAADVRPSAHTYKLLLDLYGAIEPVQPHEMERVFDELASNPAVNVQGTHWASLINCYGCVLGDVERAIATFDSIASHPSSAGRKDGASLPDAVSFEALLAVFVAHGRTDLIRAHLHKMEREGIQMTAYVANLLIRGYSMERGDAGLDEARALFESMDEPAAGVAAAGNHPPRAHGAGAQESTAADASPTAQKDRAAVRPSVTADAQGHAFGAESTRGEASRQTDYVRRAIAESLAERVQDIKRDFGTIVELGAGPGLLRHYLDAEGSGTKKIIMCDTSEALLNRDRHLDAQFPFEVERRVLDEEMLPFEEGSLDCVVVSGGLHWTNDLPGVLIQIRRALKPDGVLIAALCGGDTLFELRTSLQLAEQEREGGISPRISPMADTRDMASLLSRAGFTIPTVDVDEVQVGYPSMYELMHDLRDMGESNAVINRRGQLRRDTMLSAAAIYEAMHGQSGGEAQQPQGVPATFQLIFLIGWSPAPTQPKPLKRGSATSSLKDVLAGSEGDVQGHAEAEMEHRQRAQWMKTMAEDPTKPNKK
ncbi:hypothetical protein PANT_24d00052 [Moesziomyces antarcticus T-34]|uniref:Pentatricopeptide repeat protein n=1 Tax=Pseudozyma antarctica (strain T-34) TaxID=1151754 RepID=M9LST5_PSEA3|nr:hypothetical protein PANT_24d00052 [Moesziomyces antarcticus T-34]